MTTGSAGAARRRNGPRSPKDPVAAAYTTPARGVSRRASTDWVSGSPNRALNSITFTPEEVNANPQYNSPTNGVPRRAISATVGWATLATTSSTSPGGVHGRGE